MGRAISPEQLRVASHIPNAVFDIVNELIREKFDGSRAVVTQEAIISRVLVAALAPSREIVLDRGWLNFEPEYEKAGWIVEYDKPAYCETYPATFTFRVGG